MSTNPVQLPPPQTRARERENRQFAEELRRHPGRWAMYPWPTRYPHSTKHRLRTGMAAAFGPGFESEVRAGVVYVRYNPQQPSAALDLIA
ncbi:hypothetical protein RTZ71_18380 [Rhodococcus qingshengii]|uniref:hypothetical protein n=1 Tax=Rhodococcus qingshengii TaxID=334542 RepID=UPI0028F2E70A|nr:hypothetical protein [Rhodococcus qingshengii]MDT9662677.1 hypothetical protein [Rhodococcus qingshengii]